MGGGRHTIDGVHRELGNTRQTKIWRFCFCRGVLHEHFGSTLTIRILLSEGAADSRVISSDVASRPQAENVVKSQTPSLPTVSRGQISAQFKEG